MNRDVDLELALLALQSRDVRERLLRSAAGPLRYAPFARRVATFFGISRARAEAVLERIASEPAVWTAMPVDGLHMAEIEAARFLRADPGTACPAHMHHGEERLLILEGRLIAASGLVSGPGDLIVNRSAFLVVPPDACVSAYRIDGGVS